MSVVFREFISPKRLDYDKETMTDRYGKFVAEPFERGFATTIGNALRRHLISSIDGAAISYVKFDGVYHEFATMPGVVEDVANIILNLKGLRFKLHAEGPKSVYIHASGKGAVTGKDVEGDADVEVVNPDCHIATLDTKGKLDIEMIVEKGRGYVSSDKHPALDDPQMIPIDSIFSPVERVNFQVGNTRVGASADYENLVLEIWTDGSIKPEDAVAYSAKILKNHLQIFIHFDEEEEIKPQIVDEEKRQILGNLMKSVDELELSVRSANCLDKINIKTIMDLVERTETEMLDTENFGRKSLNEIKDLLVGMDLSLGMNVEEYRKELEKNI
ncbi:MAG: DNA-directed RNA polymerase subunit alpha [Nitrospinota bacterium]|nr:DNA-directed RNA polymerase subunit alpha [Nitrospinota bacterium]